MKSKRFILIHDNNNKNEKRQDMEKSLIDCECFCFNFPQKRGDKKHRKKEISLIADMFTMWGIAYI